MSLEINPYIWAILEAARAAYGHYAKVPRITSANDGKHMDGSLHYQDRAVDLRTGHHWKKPWLTKTQVEWVMAAMRKHLGPDYDVVLEPDHLHVEHDPDA